MAIKKSSASVDFTEVGLHEAAAICGKSVTTLKSWFNLGCPVIERGGKSKKWRISPAAVMAWREEKIAQDAVGDTKNLDFEEARRRKIAAEAGMAELDFSLRRGELIPIEDIANLVGEEYANVRAKLLAIPVKMAPLMLGLDDLAKARGLLEDSITEAMEELTADEQYSGYESEEGAGEAPEESQAAA